MSGDELLEDLHVRCGRAIANLESMARQADEAANRDLSLEASRLRGKAEGVAVVRDWLRSYRGLSSGEGGQ